MEVHDHRLSISKASASKISKPSPVLKILSASSSSSSSSSSPPGQLPSSITSSPSRPISKVVNADPSSFRRVVQELTGTTLPSTSKPSSSQPLRGLSRLHRIAPPPLRSSVRTLQESQHRQPLLEQTQHRQASQMQQHLPKVGPLSPTLPFTQFGNPNPSPIFDPTTQERNPNPNFTPSLPMLSPHLLAPLPALTPRDNTWANPFDAISESPKPMMSTSSSWSPLLPLPNLSSGNYTHGHGNALIDEPAHVRNVYGDTMLTKSMLPMSSSMLSSQGQALPPLLSTPPSPPWLTPHASSMNVLPPWSPSPIPFSPGLLLPSPRPGAPPMAGVPNILMNSNLPKNFTF